MIVGCRQNERLVLNLSRGFRERFRLIVKTHASHSFIIDYEADK